MRNHNKGFTLLEMVIAMVVLSIIMIGIGSYIALGVKGYTNTIDRERLQSQARFLVARMTKEIRHAAPNSLVTEDRCIRFYPIVSSAVYYAELPNNSDELNVSPFDFENKAIWDHNGWHVAVGFASAEQYQNNTITVDSISAAKTNDNNQAGNLFQLILSSPIITSSPGKRLYLYHDQISYCQLGDTIVRKVNNSDGVLMATNIVEFMPKVQAAGLNSGAIALIGIKFSDPKTNEIANYNHSVQVLNVL
ncbi:PilW family protein [Photobacterium piscicola]|uniref:Prepilin-type N-terminal cleavage/methylation domain-containing protein n=1 Tax=Photobacterium piscicola TaxID=1378299 RepID=A0ABU6LJ65_9GAMM|nr:prepilin-type N-terminal cleavage/methylation domain-containing protein [Photobacterium piscicola]